MNLQLSFVIVSGEIKVLHLALKKKKKLLKIIK